MEMITGTRNMVESLPLIPCQEAPQFRKISIVFRLSVVTMCKIHHLGIRNAGTEVILEEAQIMNPRRL